MGGGIPSLADYRGLGERRELPQRGPGGAPAANAFFCIFEVHRTLLVERTCVTLPNDVQSVERDICSYERVRFCRDML